MKVFKISCVVAMLIFAASLGLKAQNYGTGIGVRTGASTGVTFKQFISSYGAIEAIAARRWSGWNFTGLYEYHQRLYKSRRGGRGGFDSQRLHWFAGIGAHIGVWDAVYTHPWFTGGTGGSTTIMGVDGIIGLEYAFIRMPVSISLDYKPAVNLVGLPGNTGRFWGDEIGISARFIFG